MLWSGLTELAQTRPWSFVRRFGTSEPWVPARFSSAGRYVIPVSLVLARRQLISASSFAASDQDSQTALIRFGSNGLVNRWIQASFSCLRMVPNGSSHSSSKTEQQWRRRRARENEVQAGEPHVKLDGPGERFDDSNHIANSSIPGAPRSATGNRQRLSLLLSYWVLRLHLARG